MKHDWCSCFRILNSIKYAEVESLRTKEWVDGCIMLQQFLV